MDNKGGGEIKERRPKFVLFTSCILFFIFHLSYAGTADKINESLSHLVSIELRGAQIQEWVRYLSHEYDLNILVDQDITGTVTVSFKNVSLREALDAILQSCGYTFVQENNIIRIKAIEQEVFTFNYASASQVKEDLAKLKSDKGNVLIDEKTNSIIVIDSPLNIRQIREYLKTVDLKQKQVVIEAKIVEVTLDKSSEFGINWADLNIPLDHLLGSAAQDVIARRDLTDPTKYTGTGGFQFTVIKGGIDVVLQALATRYKANLLSAPKVVTINNVKAIIKVVEKVPYTKKTISPFSGVEPTQIIGEVEFEETGITLEVTPQVTQDSFITIIVHPKVSEVTEWYEDRPVVDARETETHVIIKNGETIVIGGLIRDNVIENITKVPILGDIPILKILFRRKEHIVKKTDLVIFLSSSILSE